MLYEITFRPHRRLVFHLLIFYLYRSTEKAYYVTYIYTEAQLYSWHDVIDALIHIAN